MECPTNTSQWMLFCVFPSKNCHSTNVAEFNLTKEKFFYLKTVCWKSAEIFCVKYSYFVMGLYGVEGFMAVISDALKMF